MLFRLADFLEAQNKLRAKIISALFYPIVMTVIGAGIMTMLMVSVVPKVTSIFADTRQGAAVEHRAAHRHLRHRSPAGRASCCSLFIICAQ